MKPSTFLRRGVALALIGAAACEAPTTSQSPLSPSAAAGAKAAAPTSDDEVVAVSPILQQMNAQLAAAKSNIRIDRAQLLYSSNGISAQKATVLLANDRSRGIGIEWVPGDPRRGGRIGVTYAFGSNTGVAPFTRDANGGNVRQLTTAEQDAKIEQAVAAWRALTCSSAPITRVPVPAGTDPDYLDEFFRGNPGGSANYAQPADIVEAGWQPPGFFNAIAGPDGDFILGITFTFYFPDGQGNPTDIDRNGKADAALAEIFYNAGYYFGDRAANSVDFFSILAHETGHGLGLGHFGKLFVTAKDAADGITASDVKFAPLALMNAGYVFPNVIQGTDNSQFCQIWASR